MDLGSLTPDERRALTALLEALRKRFPDTIDRVVLFGSKSRGDSDSESDIDLLMVVKEYKGRAQGCPRCISTGQVAACDSL